jgi:hypothetical protein
MENISTLGDESTESKRNRSPAYPAIDLPEAVRIAKLIREAAGKTLALVSSDVISEQLGLKENGSMFRLKMSALKKFELVQEAETDLWQLTPDGEWIAKAPSEILSRSPLARNIALRPHIYRDLYNRFSPAFPRRGIAQYLLEQKFNPKVIQGVIDDFSQTLVFAGVGGPIDAHAPLSTSEMLRGFVDEYESGVFGEASQLLSQVVQENAETFQRMGLFSASTPSVRRLAATASHLLKLQGSSTKGPLSLEKAMSEPPPAYGELSSMESFFLRYRLQRILNQGSDTFVEKAMKYFESAEPALAPPAPTPTLGALPTLTNSLQIPLGEGRQASIPYPMDETSYEILMETLRLWKPKIVTISSEENKNA